MKEILIPIKASDELPKEEGAYFIYTKHGYPMQVLLYYPGNDESIKDWENVEYWYKLVLIYELLPDKKESEKEFKKYLTKLTLPLTYRERFRIEVAWENCRRSINNHIKNKLI